MKLKRNIHFYVECEQVVYHKIESNDITESANKFPPGWKCHQRYFD
jgi:hypothetical protein